MEQRIFVSIIVILLLPVAFSASYAGDPIFGKASINVGISKLTGDESKYWDLGFCVEGNTFYQLAPGISLGMFIAFNKWTPDETELIESMSLTNLGIDWDISGAATIIESGPLIRLGTTGAESQDVNLFGQIGLSFSQTNSEVTVKGSYIGSTVEVSTHGSENRFALSIGGGVVINRRFEILPLYYIVFTEGEKTKYFSLNIGVLWDSYTILGKKQTL